MKNFFISLGVFILFFLSFSFIFTVIEYFSLFKCRIVDLIFLYINVLVSAFILGKKASSHGYIEGVKLGGTISLLFLIVSLIFKKFTVRSLFCYTLIILVAVIGSMIGINFKIKKSEH